MRTEELKGSKNSSSSSHFRMISPMGKRIKNVITRLRHVGRQLKTYHTVQSVCHLIAQPLFNHFSQCCELNGRLNAMKLRSKQQKCTLQRRIQERGGGGSRHPAPEVRGGPLSKNCFLALQASIWSTNKGGGGAGLPGPSPGSAFRPRENSELAHRNPIFVKPLFTVVRRPVHMNTGENKYTVSKISGFVWTGPKMESQCLS